MEKPIAWSLCFVLVCVAAALAQDKTETQISKLIAEATKEKPFVNSLGMKFVPTPGTNVLFSIWDTRVQDYRAYAEANAGVDASWKKPGFSQGGDEPVVAVNYDDAKAFCAWLTTKERKEGKITAHEEYRLPTDAEWTAAAGAGKYPWGDQWPPPKNAGNYAGSLNVDTFDYTSPVGSFAANTCGLFDMGGDVRQCCEGWYDSTQKTRLYRGATFGDYVPDLLVSACRIGVPPAARLDSFGFRCVLAPVADSP